MPPKSTGVQLNYRASKRHRVSTQPPCLQKLQVSTSTIAPPTLQRYHSTTVLPKPKGSQFNYCASKCHRDTLNYHSSFNTTAAPPNSTGLPLVNCASRQDDVYSPYIVPVPVQLPPRCSRFCRLLMLSVPPPASSSRLRNRIRTVLAAVRSALG